MILYKIAEWDKYYENHRSRTLKRMDWIPIPTKMDGDGFTELLDHPEGGAHYGAWVLLLLIAAKSEPRGSLIRSGGKPHDPGTLARVSGASPALFGAALARLVQIGWITAEELKTNDMRESSDDPAISGDDPAIAARFAAQSEPYSTVQNSREQNITVHTPTGREDLWSVYWELFVIAGKALCDRDKEKALTLWLSYEPEEHSRILSWAMNQAKSVWSSAKYTPMPASALESKGWRRVAAERIIPDPQPLSKTDQAFAILEKRNRI